jgi:predicted chitinase
MAYLSRLSSTQKKNINTLIDEMEKSGLTNKNTQAGILSVISKESVFNPVAERGYQNTSNSRIKRIFGVRVSGLSEMELTQLKADPEAFFNHVYGGRYGNASNAGYMYRGRGFNQLTFHDNYKKVGDTIGVDLVSHPEKLEDPKIASKASLAYFKNAFNSGFTSTKQKAYNAKDINDFKTLNDAVLALYHANAGFGKPIYTPTTKTSTGGLEKALSRSPEFLEYVKLYSSKKKV